MSAQRPLGATEQGSVGFTADALRLRTPAIVRSSRAGLLALTGITGCVLLLCVAAAHTQVLLPETLHFPSGALAGALSGASIDIRSGGQISTMLVMFACYVIAVRTADRLSPRAVLGCIAAINALVLLAPPLLSTDIFSYQFYGRMGATYGMNPYLAGPHALALDPLFPYVGAKWAYTPTVYGPLFTAISYIFAPLSVAASAMAYKSIAVAASLGTVALVWSAARLRGVHPVRAVALVGLNPLTVIFGVGGGHNDLLMLVALMAGVYLLLLNRERASGAMMIVAAAVKVSAILPLLFALISGQGRRGGRFRVGVFIGALTAAVALAIVSFGLFGTGPLHLPHTLETVQSRGDWHSVPGLLSALGFPTASAVISLTLGLAFLVVVAVLALEVWRGKMDWLTASGWMTAALLVTTSSLLPWYVAWLTPFAALAADRRLWRFVVLATGFILALQLAGYIPAAKRLLGV
ncbi:MAG: polyprenol phosphomannose-dependent alpha 1,6 mannosyltransferase MptB [Solirubrobacteraceae bacterium]